MSQWTIQIEPTADGRFQWRHVPAEGTGTGSPHVGGDHYDTAEAALTAGQKALAEHHETPLGASTRVDSPPATPEHDDDTRLGGSQAELEALEDPRLPSDSPLSISSLPLEAQVRTADLDAPTPSRS